MCVRVSHLLHFLTIAVAQLNYLWIVFFILWEWKLSLVFFVVFYFCFTFFPRVRWDQCCSLVCTVNANLAKQPQTCLVWDKDSKLGEKAVFVPSQSYKSPPNSQWMFNMLYKGYAMCRAISWRAAASSWAEQRLQMLMECLTCAKHETWQRY